MQGCQINQEYLTSFEKVLDVYATTSLQGSRIIESQFTYVQTLLLEDWGHTGLTLAPATDSGVGPGAYSYDSAVLNASSSAIETLLNNNALSVNGNVPTNASLEVNTTTTDSSSIGTDVFGSGDNTTLAETTPPSLFSDAVGRSSVAIYRRQQQTSSSLTPSTTSSATRTSSIRTSTRTSAATTPSPQNYLGAVMAAANLTVGGLQSATPSPSPTSNSSGGGGASTSLAMIILYAITGIVTLLFLVVIMSGAIRAARHPERYGPRAAGGAGGRGGGAGRTRAEGLTKAILDTFPVVRWGGGGGGGGRGEGQGEVESEVSSSQERRRRAGDEEHGSIGSVEEEDGRKKSIAAGVSTENIELAVMPAIAAVDSAHPGFGGRRESHASTIGGTESLSSMRGEMPLLPDGSSSSSTRPGSQALAPPVPSSTTRSSSEMGGDHAPPPQTTAAVDAIIAATPMESDSESCPICLTEFEEGDELRILPCDERHRFHSECIDPFLLNVSRLCPLCRLDLGHVGGGGGAHDDDDGEGGEEDEFGGPGGIHSHERREEERVIRHLRALLHRSSSAANPNAGTTAPTTATTAVVADEGGSDSAAGTQQQHRLRNRFAQYVVSRRRDREERRRTRRGSSSAAASSGGGVYYGAPPF